MNNLINVSFRSFLILVILFFITKLLGKKQISQLSLFDYAVGISIGSIAADISLDIEKNLLAGIISLLIYGLMAYIISKVTIKNIYLRRFFIGVPTVLVENSKIIESGLKKVKLDVNELLAEARIQGYFNLDEINYAIMEINGNISFLPKEKEKSTTKKDMNINCNENSLTANVIIDGKLLENNLKSINKDKTWIDHELKLQGYKDYKNILLATIDNNEKLIIYKKNVKPNKNTILE